MCFRPTTRSRRRRGAHAVRARDGVRHRAAAAHAVRAAPADRPAARVRAALASRPSPWCLPNLCVSAQPTVSALPLVSAHPTVSAVPQLSELVSALDPPWLSLWLVPPPTLWLVELATPVLWPVALLTPTAMPDESAEACEEELALPAVLLKVTPVPCPVVSAAPLLSVCDAPALPETTPGTPALIEPLRPSLTPELVRLRWWSRTGVGLGVALAVGLPGRRAVRCGRC